MATSKVTRTGSHQLVQLVKKETGLASGPKVIIRSYDS